MAEKLLTANEKTNEQVTKNFNLKELEYYDKIPTELLDNARNLCKNLQKIRDTVGKPLKILSGYRSWARQQIVNPSVKKSLHMEAMAADLQVDGMTATELHKIILNLIEKKEIVNGGVGIYLKSNFVHFDIRPNGPARWNGD